MVKMLELSMSKQEEFGVTEQREKVQRILAIKEYVREIELCPEINGLLDCALWGDDGPYDKLANECDGSQKQCGCRHCVANVERYGMISAFSSSFSVHLFHFDSENSMDHLVPGCSATQLFLFLSWNICVCGFMELGLMCVSLLQLLVLRGFGAQ